MSAPEKKLSKREAQARDLLDWFSTPLGQFALETYLGPRVEALEARVRETVERFRRARNISPGVWHQPMTI
jgi:hypothetical protein